MDNAPFNRRTYAETYEQLKKQHPDASPQGLAFEALGIMADETHAMARLSLVGREFPTKLSTLDPNETDDEGTANCVVECLDEAGRSIGLWKIKASLKWIEEHFSGNGSDRYKIISVDEPFSVPSVLSTEPILKAEETN